jgi:hypothetical protein
MKRAKIIVSVLMLFLFTPGAYAYYDDTHYCLTYYMARACGYTPDQAYRIASADQSIDYSEPTEPCQYGKAFSPSSAEGAAQIPRIKFHAFMDAMQYPDCLTKTDQQRTAEDGIQKQHDVLWDQALRVGNPGVFLHFLQDETAHGGYSSWGGHWASLGAYIEDRPLGPTCDFLSTGPEERHVAMINNTLLYLQEFMTRKNPKQPKRSIDQGELAWVLGKMREANPAPTPLELHDLETVLSGNIIGVAVRAVDLKSGPDMAKAKAVIERALGRWDETHPMRGEPHRYEFDGNGELVGNQDQYCLYGDLTVNFAHGDARKSAHVFVKSAPTRGGETQESLDNVDVADTTQPAKFTNLPVGDVVVEIMADDEPLITQRIHLGKLENEATISLNGKDEDKPATGNEEDKDDKDDSTSVIGSWKSFWGPVTLSGSRTNITGYWQQAADKRGVITKGSYDPGTRTLVFHYYQDWNKAHGTVTMTLSDDGKKLSGSYHQDGGSGGWTMTRD